jgi:glycosyltransferase involved in cell wall biosynthesis
VNKEITISIITPVYNGADFIARCYENIKLQTFTDWEWVVVDDGSTDSTAAEVQKIDDARVRLISYKQNKGRGYARNLAIQESKGDWIVIWDVDDLNFPERLASIEQARLQKYDFFCSYAVVVNNDMEIKGTRGFYNPSGCLPAGFVHPTLAMKRDIVQKIGYKITGGVGGIGEDAKISWLLSLKHKGLWHEDALVIYQEEREINLVKGIDSNIAHLQTIRKFREKGIIDFDKKYIVSLIKYFLKICVLNIMRIYPRLYLNTVNARSYGVIKKGWKLAQEKIDFIASYKAMRKK